MEIIKNGCITKNNQKLLTEQKPKYKFVVTCEKCACEFSYTKKDSYKTFNAPNYSGLIGRIIDCPCCKKQIFYGTGNKVINN